MNNLLDIWSWFYSLNLDDKIFSFILLLFLAEQIFIYSSSSYPYTKGLCVYSKIFTKLNWNELTHAIKNKKNIKAHITQNGFGVRSSVSILLGTGPMIFVGYFQKSETVKLKIMTGYMSFILLLYMWLESIAKGHFLYDTLMYVAVILFFYWVNVGRSIYYLKTT